jgi:hypothetical protein
MAAQCITVIFAATICRKKFVKQELLNLLVNEVRCWLDNRDHSQISLLHLPVTSSPELRMSVVPAVWAYGVIIEGCLLIESSQLDAP